MNSKLFTLHFSLLISLLFLSSCRQQAAKAYVTELDSNDSLSILMGNSEMTRYHSDKLDIDITYPSFLRHQYLEEDQMEVFMDEDVSLSYMVEHLDDNLHRSPGQTMMGMGAELLEAGDNYSIHTGQDDDLEYYGKVTTVFVSSPSSCAIIPAMPKPSNPSSNSSATSRQITKKK